MKDDVTFVGFCCCCFSCFACALHEPSRHAATTVIRSTTVVKIWQVFVVPNVTHFDTVARFELHVQIFDDVNVHGSGVVEAVEKENGNSTVRLRLCPQLCIDCRRLLVYFSTPCWESWQLRLTRPRPIVCREGKPFVWLVLIDTPPKKAGKGSARQKRLRWLATDPRERTLVE